MTTDDLLKQGIAALKAGRKAEARGALAQAVQQDKGNEMAWLWLSGAVATNRERRICLENVLAINPDNAAARKGLESLIAKEGIRPLEAFPSKPQPTTTAIENAPPLSRASSADTARVKPKEASRTRLIVGFGLGALAIVIVAILAAWYAISSGLLTLGPTAPSTTTETKMSPDGAAVTTLTLIPTWTPFSDHPLSEATLVPLDTPTAPTSSDTLFLGDPRAYVLPLEDMPTGFSYVPEMTGAVSNEDIAGERDNPEAFLAQLEEWGRIGGYVVAYERTGWGTSYVEIWAITMETPEGAHAYLEYIEDKAIQDGGSPVSMPTVGDESSAAMFTYVNEVGLEWNYYDVRFRKSNFIGGVIASALSGTANFDDALDLARKLEARVTDPPPTVIVPVLPTSVPTAGPAPTSAPTMIPTPVVVAINETQTLGPIWNSTRDESYSVQISVEEVRFHYGDEFQSPKPGYVYVIVNVTIKNLGPDPVRSVGEYDFQMRDADGALRDTEWMSSVQECDLDLVDLGPGGSVSGCMGFEVPTEGKLELIYAPYKYEGLEEGRYLSFTIRP